MHRLLGSMYTACLYSVATSNCGVINGGEFLVTEKPLFRHLLSSLLLHLFAPLAGDRPGHFRQPFCNLSISKGRTRQVLDFTAFAASRNEAVAILERGVLADRLEIEGCECNSFTGV